MARSSFLCCCILATTALVSVAEVTSPDRWPQFRGTQGKGHAQGNQQAPIEFGLNKNLAWKTALPRGLSSPCIWDDRIFVTSFQEDEQALETICMDRSTGAILWRKSIVPEKLEQVHQVSSPATATAACDGHRVYVYFGSYGVVAYDMAGNLSWELPLSVARVAFGSGASPIIAGQYVVVNRLQGGGRHNPAGSSKLESELLAVDRSSGEIAWRTSLPKGRCHATPVYLRRADSEMILLPNDNQLACFDLNTGKQQWTLGGLPRVPTATPVVDGDLVYYNMTSRGGDVGLVEPPSFVELLKAHDANQDEKLQRSEIPESLPVLTRHRPDAAGDFGFKRWFFRGADEDRDGAIVESEWTAFFENMAARQNDTSNQQNAVMAIRLPESENVAPQITWKQTKGVPEVPSLLVHEGRIYAICNGGILICYRADDGEMLYRRRLRATGGYYASPVTDGNHVFLASLAGTITIVRPDDKFHRVASMDLGEPINATPAIVNGTLYVRTDGHLYAFAN